MLSRRNRPCPSRRSTPNPNPCNGLQPLETSCLSFCDSRPLFSIACSLFCQNTRGGYTPPTTALWNQQLTASFFRSCLQTSYPLAGFASSEAFTGHESPVTSPFAQATNSFIYRFYAELLANPFIYRIYANTPGVGA